MMQRERHGSGGVPSEAVPRSPATVSASRGPSQADSNAPRPWDEFYQALPPNLRRELLTLAQRQGVIYAHQLPPLNGTGDDSVRTLLASILNGQVTDLPSPEAAPVAEGDPVLDVDQREAVTRALQTPDLCLIQGPPGTGKTRVAAEIVLQAALRGERVLVLAPGPAPLDRILDRLGPHDAVCAVRLLGRGERPETLPA
ncbi:MAG: AAA family ATPase, partial [Gemmataceae bacterium]|nr:AAA family ATPase [Gemmataceae bacterium]MDW8266571.1 AAA domain-containing protein [Gemmataceae bacterium]